MNFLRCNWQPRGQSADTSMICAMSIRKTVLIMGASLCPYGSSTRSERNHALYEYVDKAN